MKRMSRKERLVANEVIFRDVNQNIQEFLDESDRHNRVVEFYCECSDPECLERVRLSPRQYEQIHKNKKQFVILAGHEFPEVEKVLEKKDGYRVVEKHFKPPKIQEIDSALKAINSASA